MPAFKPKFDEVIIRGGLGNQLFGLMEAYRCLRIYGTPSVRLNVAEYNDGCRDDRPFVLDQIWTGKQGLAVQENTLLSVFRYRLLRLFSKFINFKSRADRLPGDIELKLWFLPTYRSRIGYFQNISAEVDNTPLIELKSDISTHFLSKPVNRLALHIRRGDYLKSVHSGHGLVPLGAILAEAKFALNNNDFDGITVFTDSPELFNISDFEELECDVAFDEGSDNPVHVLSRMASHQGLVASNSSFSLWAGLLCVEKKHFSLPTEWMRGIDSRVLGLNEVRRYFCTLQ
jgi:hypothetical protein